MRSLKYLPESGGDYNKPKVSIEEIRHSSIRELPAMRSLKSLFVQKLPKSQKCR